MTITVVIEESHGPIVYAKDDEAAKRALLEKLVIARSDRDDYACILERHEVLAEHTVEQERALVSARPHLIPVVKIAD